MPKIVELQRERAEAVNRCREITDKAETENRNLSAEEQAEYDRAWKAQGELKDRITRQQEQQEVDRTLAAATALEAGDPDPEAAAILAPRNGFQVADRTRATAEFQAAFQRLLTGASLREQDHQILNALQADSDEGGGYTIMPEQMVNILIKSIDDVLWMRQLATIFPVESALSLGAVSLDADPEDGDWTAEITAVDEDTQMDFGKRNLHPHLLSKLVKISKKLVRVSGGSIVDLVNARLNYKFRVTMEKAYLTGTGSGQPLGVFTASDDGIGTGRDYATDNTSSAITADNLVGQKYNIKEAYRMNANWVFHRDALAMIAKLKDGDGNYLWRQALAAGEPDRILNMPVRESEYAPNTFTTGLYVGLLGDFSHYWIADAMNVAIQVLLELYAGNNQNGYIARYEGDGMPVLAEAFTRVKLG